MPPMPSHYLRVALTSIGFTLAGCSSSNEAPAPAPETGPCSAKFTACGGDVTGTWNFKETCVTGNLVDQLNAAFGSPQCAGTFTKASLASSSGTVTYEGEEFTRSTTVEIKASLRLTNDCLRAVTESGEGLTLQTCSSYVESSVIKPLRTGPGITTSASCNYSGSTCDCEMTSIETTNIKGTFTVDGSTLTESGGKTYDFCVKNNQLSERGEPTVGVDGVAILTK